MVVGRKQKVNDAQINHTRTSGSAANRRRDVVSLTRARINTPQPLGVSQPRAVTQRTPFDEMEKEKPTVSNDRPYITMQNIRSEKDFTVNSSTAKANQAIVTANTERCELMIDEHPERSDDYSEFASSAWGTHLGSL